MEKDFLDLFKEVLNGVEEIKIEEAPQDEIPTRVVVTDLTGLMNEIGRLLGEKPKTTENKSTKHCYILEQRSSEEKLVLVYNKNSKKVRFITLKAGFESELHSNERFTFNESEVMPKAVTSVVNALESIPTLNVTTEEVTE